MESKSLNPQRIRLAQAATGISPADFPLGSLRSRAAMRAWLDELERRRPQLSSYDEDALVLYHTLMLAGSMCPNWLDLEATEVWRRGKERAESERAGGHEEKQSLPELLEEAGITMREYFQDRFERYRQAWTRRLPQLPFPIKMEGEQVYFRQWQGDWQAQTGPVLDHGEESVFSGRPPNRSLGGKCEREGPVDAETFREHSQIKPRSIGWSGPLPQMLR